MLHWNSLVRFSMIFPHFFPRYGEPQLVSRRTYHLLLRLCFANPNIFFLQSNTTHQLGKIEESFPASNQVLGTFWMRKKKQVHRCYWRPVFSSAQETSCHLSPDFQKVVHWNARLRSIAIRSGRTAKLLRNFLSGLHMKTTTTVAAKQTQKHLVAHGRHARILDALEGHFNDFFTRFFHGGKVETLWNCIK